MSEFVYGHPVNLSPGWECPETADKLTQTHPRLRVRFLSGYASHAALPDRVTADPGAVLQKPFTVDALLAKVRERLDRTWR